MNNTQLVFVVGSGRCGTKMIKKLLAGVDHIEARHEYMRNAYQRESAMYYMGRLSYADMADKLLEIYQPAAYYSQAKIFLDSSQHLAWCTDVLALLFPTAKFVHLVRDGRKVVSSFYNKLQLFDDYAYKVMTQWRQGKSDVLPPRDEKFWMPAYGDNKFLRICSHWSETNRCIIEDLESVSDDRKLFVRLEDLTSDKAVMTKLLDFLETPYNDTFMQTMQRPEHVYVPIDYKLTDEQTEQFNLICSGMMQQLGYTGDEYRVKY